MQGTYGIGGGGINGGIVDVENTLFDFIETKLSACNEIVDYFGAGDPEDIFGYFLCDVCEFAVHGFNICHG